MVGETEQMEGSVRKKTPARRIFIDCLLENTQSANTVRRKHFPKENVVHNRRD